MTYQSVIYLQDGTDEVLPQVFNYRHEANAYAVKVADQTPGAYDGGSIPSTAVRTHYLDFFTGQLKVAKEVEPA